MKFLLVLASLLVSTFASAPQKNHPGHHPQQVNKSLQSVPKIAPQLGKILNVLKDNGLTTLLDLVIKAGLAETLSGEDSIIWSLNKNQLQRESSYDSPDARHKEE